MADLTRRELLGAASTLAAAPLLGACGSSEPVAVDSAPAVDPPAPRLDAFAFTDAQRRALSAAVAQLVPASGPGDWSAADAGAVEYIERLLNAFSDAGLPRLYGGGPV